MPTPGEPPVPRVIRLMCKQQRKRSPEVSEVLDLPNILNRGEFRRPRLDEPRKVVPLSEGAPGHDESQSTSEAQIPVDRHCFISKKDQKGTCILCFWMFSVRDLQGPRFHEHVAFGRILWANQVCKKCRAISSKKMAQKIWNSKLEGVKKLNFAVQNDDFSGLEQTVPCTLNSFIGIGGLDGKGRRKNERNDCVHIEEDIECHKQKLEGQTSICSGAIHCSLCGLVLSTNAGYCTTMSKSEPQTFNVYLIIHIISGALAFGNATSSFHSGSNAKSLAARERSCTCFTLCLTC